MKKRVLTALVMMLLAAEALVAQMTTTGTTERRVENLVLRPRRQVPSLGVFMLAYESMQNGGAGIDPRLVSALRNAIQKTPGADRVFADLNARYRALRPEQRSALVGPELANATSATVISREVINRALHPQPRSGPAAPASLTDAEVAAASKRVVAPAPKPGSVEKNDDPPGIVNIKTGGASETQVMGEPTLTLPKITIPKPALYSMRYKGMFCSTEASDGGSASEPYAIFTMVQGGDPWVVLEGPYGSTDSGDKIYKDIDLDKSNFATPLHLSVLLMENDSWDPKAVASAIKVGALALCEYITDGSCPTGVMGIVNDVIDWFMGIFGNDDDQLGDIVNETIDVKTYFKSAYHQVSTDHGFVRTEAMLFDRPSTSSDGRYWLFFELRKLNP